MKYTCFKTIVSKVFDGEIDEEEARNVISLLKEKETTCSLQIRNTHMLDPVRILSINGNKVTWRFCKDGSSLRGTTKISEIVAIEVHADDELAVKLKPKATRWSTLDTSE